MEALHVSKRRRHRILLCETVAPAAREHQIPNPVNRIGDAVGLQDVREEVIDLAKVSGARANTDRVKAVETSPFLIAVQGAPNAGDVPPPKSAALGNEQLSVGVVDDG